MSGNVQATELVSLTEHVCIDFFRVFWSEEPVPKACKSIFNRIIYIYVGMECHANHTLTVAIYLLLYS